MEYSKAVKVLQFIAGLIGIVIGVGMAFVPVVFQSSAGITLGENVSLLSETRSPGSLLLVGSLIVLVSVFKSSLRYIALVLTSLMYLGYGVGRIISLIVDGLPHQSLLIALVFELLVGGIAFFVLCRSKIISTI